MKTFSFKSYGMYNFFSIIDTDHTKMTSLKTFEDEDKESSYGFVFAVSGPG